MSQITPLTRWFRVRDWCYRVAGVDLQPQARLCGTVRVHHHNVSVGQRTWVGAGAVMIPTQAAAVKIGGFCDIGPGVMLVAGTHTIGTTERRAGPGSARPVNIGDGSWVGARSTFVAGSGVGRGCVVAAGAVVTENFGDDVLIAGVPARVVRHLGD